MKFNKDKFRKIRESKMTGAVLAERMGVTRSAVTQWETGAAAPSSQKFSELARVLDCSIADFCDEDDAATSCRTDIGDDDTLVKINSAWPRLTTPERGRMLQSLIDVFDDRAREADARAREAEARARAAEDALRKYQAAMSGADEVAAVQCVLAPWAAMAGACQIGGLPLEAAEGLTYWLTGLLAFAVMLAGMFWRWCVVRRLAHEAWDARQQARDLRREARTKRREADSLR